MSDEEPMETDTTQLLSDTIAMLKSQLLAKDDLIRDLQAQVARLQASVEEIGNQLRAAPRNMPPRQEEEVDRPLEPDHLLAGENPAQAPPENQPRRNQEERRYPHYAAAVRDGRPRAKKGQLSDNELLNWARNREKPNPQKFKRYYIKLSATKKMQHLPRPVLYQYAYRLLNAVKIRRQVKDISLIVRSILELYVAEICDEEFNAKIAEVGITLLEDFDPSQPPKFATQHPPMEHAIRRLAILLSRNPIRKMQKAILQPYD
jgi:hypothetical protein